MAATTVPSPRARTDRWVFLTRRSLPDDPTARALEKRGRWWLVVSYVLCPCHLPITLSLLGVAFAGTAFGTMLAANTGAIAGVLIAAYAVVLWRGFSRLRAAKKVLAPGERLQCNADACEVVPR